MGSVLTEVGIVTVVFGLLVELAAFAASAWYPLRRRLPFKTPLELQSWACIGFVIGLVLLGVGRWVGR